MTQGPDRPLVPLPVVTGSPPGDPPRHETVLPAEATAALTELATARAAGGVEPLRAVCGRYPAVLVAWAALGRAHLDAGDPVAAYACARVGYHRGLDRLRRNGWGGTGMVRWERPGNRGFLLSLHLLLGAAALLGETEESARCRDMLLELDPDDPLGVRAYPAVPDRGFSLPRLDGE